MTNPISIGTNTMPGLIFNRLNNNLHSLLQEGLPLNIDVDRIGEYTFLDCALKGKIRNEEKAFHAIKTYIANCLADIIIDEWEARIIRKIIRENYFYYNEEEKQSILARAKEILNPAGLEGFPQKLRREKVIAKIEEYLDLHKELILEGFINFRLKDYQNELEEIVNSAVDEFMLEKEYNEFVRLLKYFVDIQEARVEKVKIFFRNSGRFTLLDGYDKPLNHECLEGLMADMLESDINYDDLLISALITLAPREVEIHLEKEVKEGDTIRTIRNVFGRRVSQCAGCEKCQPRE